VLKRWGFDYAKTGETEKRQYRKVAWDAVETLVQDHGLADIETIYGTKFIAFHRVDLHNGMRGLAEHEGVDIKLGHDVDDLDVEACTLCFKDRTKIHTDLIIIADGIKSPFVHKITGHPIKHSPTGRSVFRTLIPIRKLMADSAIRPLYEDEPSGFVNSSMSPAGVFIVTYPCRNDTLMNFAMFHKTLPSHNRRDSAFDWNAGADLEDAKRLVEDWHPAWKALTAMADGLKVYSVAHRPEIDKMHNGKTIIVGDAAHPMMPTHAQGGSMAIEDAAALEVLLADLKPDGDFRKRLELWEQLRLPRCATTQILSNAMFYESGLKKTELVRRYYQGPLFNLAAESWSEPIREFFYAYDIAAEAEKALRYKDLEGGIPEGGVRYFYGVDWDNE